ncbi:MAG: hypothetical protein AAGB28_18335 [Pseudomonadota bacterium]
MDNIIRAGDQAIFLPTFGSALVTVIPGVMTGTGATTMTNGPPTCVQGDEKLCIVPGCAYINAAYAIPGVGTLMIQALGPDQTSKKTTIGGKPVIVKGTFFTAKFQVMVPAQMPTPTGPVPDAVPMFMGQGQFMTTNMTVMDMG